MTLVVQPTALPPPLLLTSADVHDVVEGVPALHDVHHQLGEAQVVLGEQRVDGHRLDHVVHQEESLCVLEAALRQVPPRAALLQRPTLDAGNKVNACDAAHTQV